MDCRNFSQINGEYFCSEYIGGTKVTWASGKRQCDPPSDAWHYCACYHGPQVSKDIWVWPHAGQAQKKGPRQVGGDLASGQDVQPAGGDRSDTKHYTPAVRTSHGTFPSAPPQAAQVGPRSNISVEAEQGGERKIRTYSKTTRAGIAIGTPPAMVYGDRGGNGREHPFCLLRRRIRWQAQHR